LSTAVGVEEKLEEAVEQLVDDADVRADVPSVGLVSFSSIPIKD